MYIVLTSKFSLISWAALSLFSSAAKNIFREKITKSAKYPLTVAYIRSVHARTINIDMQWFDFGFVLCNARM